MQLHKRLSLEQVKAILAGYGEGKVSGVEALDLLGVKRAVFFELVKRYRKDPGAFSIEYHRKSPRRIGDEEEKKIKQALWEDRRLVENPKIPVWSYNYSAVRDRLLKKEDVSVSVPTLIERAKRYGCYKPQKERRIHDRQVLTTAIGGLVQHDASHHLWSPYAQEKWVLITSLDDYSRTLLYAEFAESESTWAHIEAVRSVVGQSGVPLRYYVDSLRIFRFVSEGGSIWEEQNLKTDDVNPQWKRCVELAGAKVIYALSPQAKGKIERPYRWLQDRIVRTCALEKISRIKEGREVLRAEVERYNHHQVHSTTLEVPSIRFARARKEGATLFRPFLVPKPYTHIDDIFCLQETRTTDGYRKISLWNQVIAVPKVDPYEDVEIHIIPNRRDDTIGIRIWCEGRLVLVTTFPRTTLPKVRF